MHKKKLVKVLITGLGCGNWAQQFALKFNPMAILASPNVNGLSPTWSGIGFIEFGPIFIHIEHWNMQLDWN